MKHKILIVEDDTHLRFGITFNLEKEGYEVIATDNGEEGLELARDRSPDLVLLDIMLPGITGLEVLEKLRETGESPPVMMLTARADESDAVCALSLGADDYVRKPFGVSELVARIGAVIRRARPAAPSEATTIGRWRLELENLRCLDGADVVTLTTLEVEILRVLLERRGDVCRREELLERVWGVGAGALTRTLDNHVARLRKKIERDPAAPDLVLTVHGVGYKLST